MKRPALFLFVFLGLYVSGHEFWIQPDKFLYKRGETVNMKFFVGENFEGKNWTGNKDKVQNLELFFEDVKDTNLHKNLTDAIGDSLRVVMMDEGTVVVTMNTKNSFIELDADKFNAYLKEDGLNEALDWRMKNNDTAKAGREYYQRSVKTILQIGNKYNNTYKKKTSLPLDIIPDDNPYNAAKDGNFKVKLFFNGEALKNTKVKVWHKLDNKLSTIDYVTNEEGEVKFFLAVEGEWMISCVKMVRVENDPRADWQSYWGSLTWGYY
jgi:uncharacterized GH25 family protein